MQFLFLATAHNYACADEPEKKPAAPAKPAAVQRLLDRTPFDLVILNQANNNQRLEVLPLNLPQRPLAAIPQTGSLKMRLLDRPTEEFEVAWTNVAAVRIFEQVLLDEAQRLTATGKFDEAYDYYVRLQADFPNLQGLDDAVCNYLRQNALALFQAKQYDRALALLLTLYQRNPQFAGLQTAVESVANELIQKYLRDGDYTSARRVLELWQTQFKTIAPQSVAAWQSRFQSAASRQVVEANTLLNQKQFIPARKAVARALAIWPSLDSATQTLARIEQAFPYMTVGVLETSPRVPGRRIDDWASLRTSDLTQRLLAEETDFGAEGGIYRSSLGEWMLDETGKELTLKLAPNGGSVTADAVSRHLLSMTARDNPNHREDLATLIDSVSLGPPDTVVVHLQHVHVRPEALLQLALPAPRDSSGRTSSGGLYSLADHTPTQAVFTLNRADAAQAAGPQAIVEQTLASDDVAFAALKNGDVDVLDRVPPWQVERLRAITDVHVGAYKLPTVHVLIPNLARPLLAKREFRRALSYGIDRKWIVDRVLLAGATVPGIVPVSGPFPAGTSLSDPVRYGYNNQVQPRPFEPRLASILATVAWAAVQNPPEKDKPKGEEIKTAAKKEVEITDLPTLVLAHPADAVARVACQSIQAQLEKVGITVTLREFTADELIAGKVDCDLHYAELAVWEPVANARQILGPGGLVGDLQSAYLDAALRNLDAATNWKDVRSRLAELHEITNHELPLIPLWQTVNYFAHRKNISGVGDSPVTLYQNVEQWSTAAPGNVASAQARLQQ